jgi:flagellar FliJ protein
MITMRFVYPFQQIVDLKTNEKKQAESELSEAINNLNVVELEMNELKKNQWHQKQGLHELASEGVSIAHLLQKQQYIDFLEDRIQQSQKRMSLAEQAVEDSRKTLTDRMVDEKVWLQTKEKAKVAFQTSMLQIEQNQLDEMATMRTFSR